MSSDLCEFPRDDDEGVNLTSTQAEAVALRFIADWCRHGEDPQWEDLPSLGEFSFERLCVAFVRVAGFIEAEAERRDALHGIDSLGLYLEASDEPEEDRNG